MSAADDLDVIHRAEVMALLQRQMVVVENQTAAIGRLTAIAMELGDRLTALEAKPDTRH
jgi:hypothetical protein